MGNRADRGDVPCAAVSTVPASMWMTQVGRRIGFIAGASLGTLGGLIAAAGMFTSSLTLLCLGTFLAGTGAGAAVLVSRLACLRRDA